MDLVSGRDCFGQETKRVGNRQDRMNDHAIRFCWSTSAGWMECMGLLFSAMN